MKMMGCMSEIRFSKRLARIFEAPQDPSTLKFRLQRRLWYCGGESLLCLAVGP